MTKWFLCRAAILCVGVTCAFPALANEPEEARRTRVGLGVQLVPSFPGSDDVVLRPLIDVARAKGNEEFEFEAPDESFGIALFKERGFAFGPAINLEGNRKAKDVGADLPKVGLTLEVGAFGQYALSEKLQLRAEVRKGIGGHDAMIGNLGADFVSRKGDQWLFSIGPRVTIASRKYQQAYFGISPADSVRSGLPAFTAEGGLMAAGLTAGYLRQLTQRWGVSTYAKYDRLIGDAVESPITRRLGSRNQLHGGLALTYTFGSGVAD